MPEPEDPTYPPQFASSDLASLLGQIGDFAGNEPPPPPPPAPPGAKSKAKAAAKGRVAVSSAALTAPYEGGAVPVTITGIDAPKSPYFAGLREALIGASIIRLAEQLKAPQSAEFRTRALALGNELVQSGGARLTTYTYVPPPA